LEGNLQCGSRGAVSSTSVEKAELNTLHPASLAANRSQFATAVLKFRDGCLKS